jgi:hypothetical protein
VGYNSVRTFSNAQQKAFAERSLAEHPSPMARGRSREPEKITMPKGHNERCDHFVNFFKSVRGEQPVFQDATFGFRAAAPALLCNESYYQGKSLGWDPVGMKVVS